MVLSFIGLSIVLLSIAYRQHRLVRRVDRLEERIRSIEQYLVICRCVADNPRPADVRGHRHSLRFGEFPMSPSEQEFGSDGQVHPIDRPLAPLAAAEKRAESADPFEASEPASAAQRHPMENLLLTTARAVEHLTRTGDGKQHNGAVKAAIGAVEADDSKFGG